MSDTNHLYILWTSDNLTTAEKMVFMYGINAKRREWWKNVTIILWGAPPQMVVEHRILQQKIEEAQLEGVHITACKACADQLGVTEELESMNIEVIYWGEPLTKLLKNGEKLITV
jgi:hypothetical protein